MASKAVTKRSSRPAGKARRKLHILVVDVGGTNVKLKHTGSAEIRKFPSGPGLTGRQMVKGVLENTADWEFDAVTIGYPGPVVNARIVQDPVNLGRGWKNVDFEKAFGCPVRCVNDAAMQAIGCYHGGRMLFLGLGTGLGTTAIFDGVVAPMEGGHLPYLRKTFEDYVGEKGLKRLGKKKWRSIVADVVKRLAHAFQVEYVVLGGGHVRYFKKLPPMCREGSNLHAFVGGFRLWEQPCKFILGGDDARRRTR